MKRYACLVSLLILLSLVIGCSRSLDTAQAASPDGSQPAPFSGKPGLMGKSSAEVTVPAGTPIAVRMQTAVSSATASPGDRFDAVLDEALIVNGQTLSPKGATVTGRVVAAKHSGHLHDPGYLRVALASMNINGHDVPLQSSSIFLQGGSHKKRNWAIIGGSTAGGALIGGLMGGGKGALIGSAVGAGAGTTGAYATGKKEVGIGVERRLTFRLEQPPTVKG